MDTDYGELYVRSFREYWQYVSQDVSHPGWNSYFYWLVGLSLFFWGLELIMPWRKGQPRIRRDFWLDGFYMFFNIFIFALIGYHALATVFVTWFNGGLRDWFGLENLVAVEVGSWPVLTQLLVLFVLRDFIQWNVHRLLHRSNRLWEFHKVHHSVAQMGFAAHLRFHWVETIVYRVIEYLPLGMIGFGIDDFFAVHICTLTVGHFNHSNIRVPLGPLRYLLNNPQMHIWHHAEAVPRRFGVNFGLTLSVWDFIFRTAYMPGKWDSGRDVRLGFQNLDAFPRGFIGQELYPLSKGWAARRARSSRDGPDDGRHGHVG